MKKLLGSLVTFMLISLSLSVFSNFTDVKAAFGTSPPWVKNDSVLPGTTFEQVINLSRNETETAMKATIRLDGDAELIKWIEIQDKDNLIMKAGQTILPMKVVVTVPKNAVGKKYTGGIFITLGSAEANPLGGGEVAIGLGAHISVDITVIGNKAAENEIKPAIEKPQEVKPPEVKKPQEVKPPEIKPQVAPATPPEAIVVTPKDAIPPLSMVPTVNEGEETVIELPLIQRSVSAVTPIVAPEAEEISKMYLLFSLIGLGVAFISLIGILVILVMARKRRL